MPPQDTEKIKEKIISVLKFKGPSLPVQIAREIESNILFTSAFLSELSSEKKIKISNMKVGNSPLYFIQGQEPVLERFSHYLKSREKDAFELLRQKKFLKDSEQEPAIRVALRQIHDFAIPFKRPETGELIWRYFTVPESEKPEFMKEIPVIASAAPEAATETAEGKSEKSLDIFDKPKSRTKAASPRKKAKTTRKKSEKENKFFNNIKEFLSKNFIELIDIKGFNKNEIVLHIREKGEEKILVSYNKKRINEADIVKAAKKSQEFSLPYSILSFGSLPKKTDNLLEALKNLSDLKKIE